MERDKDLKFTRDEDGILYEGKEPDTLRVVVPRSLVTDILRMHHDILYAGHQGIKRTRDFIKLRYV
jgi:hypothetical protein